MERNPKAPVDFEPYDIDYSKAPLGKRILKPRGEIVRCPRCGANALELLFSQRRGKYDASYWHLAYKDRPGEPPLAKQVCRLSCETKQEFDRARAK